MNKEQKILSRKESLGIAIAGISILIFVVSIGLTKTINEIELVTGLISACAGNGMMVFGITNCF